MGIMAFGYSAQAQEKAIDKSYTEYFKNTREVPYLHINKTSFLMGEEIWFQAYVMEQNSKKLHPTTSNLYVGVFDAKGNLKQQKLVHIKQGLGQASFYIDSSFTADKYFLKASTNWMRNFEEDNSYVQQIKIVNNSKKKTNTISENAFFDFQVFPEGGHFLSGINNTMAVLIKDKNGKGVKATNISLKDNDGNVVKEFATNYMGFGKVNFGYDNNKSYVLEATLDNGSSISKAIPAAEKRGVVLNVINPSTAFVSVNLTTNPETLPQLVGKTYTVLIHNTNSYYRNIIKFIPNNNTYSLVLSNGKLENGMNIVTIFDENNTPISERLFFNYSKEIFANTGVTSKTTAFDSIATSFANTSDEKVFLSASFLPAETKAYNPKNNIYSSFLLKPYIKGDIQNPSYYFTNTNRKKLNDLDLLLLTQGWSKYEWKNIFDDAPNTNFAFENGISVTGRLNKPLRKGNRILLVSKENNLVRDVEIKDLKFTLENSFLKENSQLDFAVNYNDNLYEIKPVLQYNRSFSANKLDTKNLNFSDNNELVISNFKNLSKGREVLNEIQLKAAKKREYDNRPYGATAMMTGYKMKDRIVTMAETVIDFLIAKRFTIDRTSGDININPRSMQTQYGSMRNTTQDSAVGQPAWLGGVRVFLNDMDISQSQWQLENIFLSNVKEIFIGRIPNNWSFEQIYIYTEETDYIARKNSKYGKVVVKHGFAKEKKYYQPNYPSYLNETYKNYGTLFWKPSIVINGNSSTTFNIPQNMQKEVSVFIEGITESGKLISKKINIKR